MLSFIPNESPEFSLSYDDSNIVKIFSQIINLKVFRPKLSKAYFLSRYVL